MSNIYDEIREKLATLCKKKPRSVFGSEVHRFRVNPPLSETAVCAFEKRYAVKLPEEYRRFITDVANGGAGPYYGLFKLGEIDDDFKTRQWRKNDSSGLIGDLSKPFPHSKAWNDRRGEPEYDYDDEDEEKAEREIARFEKKYYASHLINGAIPLCHEGCALRQYLVITGREAGNVWCDYRADRLGLKPLSTKAKPRIGFLQWYQKWLTAALRKKPRDFTI